MNKNIKINSIIFMLFSILFSCFFINKNYNESLCAHAVSEKAYIYEIENSTSNQNLISVKARYVDNSYYSINNSVSSLNNALKLIESDLLSESKSLLNTEILIYFNNFIIYENWNLNISYGHIIFSGTISNPANSSVINIEPNDVTNIKFEDFIISSSSSKIINVNQSSIKSNICLKNCSFESDKPNSYAIYFSDTACDLILTNSNAHTTSYLFNYQKYLNILFDDFSYCNIKATIPSNLNNHLVLNEINETIMQSISFLPENNTYSLNPKAQWLSKKLYFSSIINLNSNLNGGTTSEQIDNTFAYGNSFNLVSSLSNNNLYFGGWFGLCVINSETYYFDTQNLVEASSSNFEKEKLLSTFKSSLNDLSNTNSFSKFYDNTDSNNLIISDLFIALYEKLNQIPTLIAKWEYEILLDSQDETELISIKTSIDSIANLDNVYKEGYSLEGVYQDKLLSNSCDLTKIKTNVILYAKWNLNSYTISFFEELDNPSAYTTQTLLFGESINFPVLTKTGYDLTKWITSDKNEFNSKTMIGKNISIFAYWEKSTFTTIFETQGTYIAPIKSKYLDSIQQPENPTREGYSFVGWIDKDTGEAFDFSTTPAREPRTAVAQWSANSYIATFNFIFSENKLIKCGDPIAYVPNNPGYKLLGWYDLNDNKIETMPAQNIMLYPKWQQKNIITLSLNNQSNSTSSYENGYKLISNLNNFVIEYYVDNSWTTNAPSKQGTYDIRVSRAEDETFAEYFQILPNGYQLLPKLIDLDIINSILLVCFFIEIVFIIAIRWIMQKKKTAPITYSIIFPFAMFETTPFIIFIVSSLLVLIAFIWLIKDLIKLHHTSPETTPENKYDNRITIAKLEDSSNDLEIEKKVDELLKKNNLIDKHSQKDNNK